MTGWHRIAAEGTDPEALAAVVHRVREPGIGPSSLLREVLTSDPTLLPEDAVRRVAASAQPDVSDASEVRRTWCERGVRVALPGDPGYPQRLLTAWPDPTVPLFLAVLGDVRRLDREPSVAIVGARRATGYGRGIAAWLADTCADAGVHVVSGGALGIDATAHEAAVEGGTTVVLGCGHGVDYPRPHTQPGGLFPRILAAGGAMVSEHLPGTAPKPGVVRSRNRIVAALADAVVVVEGSRRSGSLLTASAAAERGIPVLAVPGDVRAPGSGAPHRLLSEGASPCTGPEDVLEAVGATTPPGQRAGTRAPVSTLPAEVLEVLRERWPRPIRVDDLADVLGTAAPVLLAGITRARVAGEIAEGPDGVRLTRAPG